jgi:hypothetical protein
MTHTHRSILLLALMALAPSALAQDGPPSDAGPGHGPPPPEAVEACSGGLDGDPCSFDSPHGTEEGSCWAPSDELPLACKPSEGPEGPPPQR